MMTCQTCDNLDSNGNGLYCMIQDCTCSPMLAGCPYYEPNADILKKHENEVEEV